MNIEKFSNKIKNRQAIFDSFFKRLDKMSQRLDLISMHNDVFRTINKQQTKFNAIFSKQNDLINSIAKQQQEAFESVKTSRQAAIKKMVRDINPLQNIFKIQAEAIRNTIVGSGISSFLKKFQEQFVNIDDLIKKLGEQNEKFIEASLWLLEHGWPPQEHLPGFKSVELMNYFIDKEFSKDKTKKELNKLFCDYYSNEIVQNNIVNNWKKDVISESRFTIIKSAIQSHYSGNYELSIPIFLVQLEGIPSEYYGYSTTNYNKFSEYFQNDDDFYSDLEDIVYKFLCANVFAGIGNDDNDLMEINRHKILHGVCVSYAKKHISLKLILILDTLINAPRFVNLPNSKIYHLPHCSCYNRTTKINKKKYRKIFTEHGARKAGLLPCKKCIDKTNSTNET